MGCDIHGVIEKRTDSGKWVTIRTLDGAGRDQDGKWICPAATVRNYRRFAALAGVRGDGPDARGLPDDASETARWKFENEGDHTPSWLPLVEAAQIYCVTDYRETDSREETYRQQFPCSFYFGEDADDVSDLRLVFWFDS